MYAAWDVLDSLLSEYNADAIVTCGRNGKHGFGSLHYIGHALDFRRWELTSTQWQSVKIKFRKALGKDFDFVIEGNHIHIEYQPK